MKKMNMKWISLVLVVFMAFTLLAPMCFAEKLLSAPVDGEAALDEAPVLTIGADEEEKEDATEDDAPKMIFEPLNFVKNLNYMGLGMLGIFIVIGVIIIATALLNKLFKDKKED